MLFRSAPFAPGGSGIFRRRGLSSQISDFLRMASTRKIVVRQSRVHGKGVFALVDIARGTKIIEYKGERISWAQAMQRHPHDPENPNHTFFFDIDDDHVIDGGRLGNSARWINHSCGPNCEARQIRIDGHNRVFIHAKRDKIGRAHV